jgi:dipeptidase E
MKCLLGSGGFRSDPRRTLLIERMRDHFGDIRRLVFLPYALADHDGYVAAMRQRGLDAGYDLVGLHTFRDPAAAIERAEGIYVGGGNTFRLTADLHRLGLLEPIRRAARAGTPYMGVSAGSNVACPTMQTTNDMPITLPPSFETLGLVDFQINAHYFAGQTHVKTEAGYVEHFGETRDDRLREYHEMNARPVVGLWEGGLLRVEGEAVRLIGAPARVFHQGRDPQDIDPPADLRPWL